MGDSERENSDSGTNFAVPKLLTTADVSEILGVPVRTLEDWRRRDYGPKFLYVGRGVRYRVGALEQWILDAELRR
ncbi:MAG: hypothetical protein CVT61_06230 [Actinobacteria bacterium HGW-Actinobacteria-11]|nr:MAG: hypothetical protein CVT61_06230 [Actinobacteria bacterium HGW-Actinobacteria-11]